MPFFQSTTNIRLYYEAYEPDNDGLDNSTPTLVFVHGLASSSRIWAGQVKKLSGQYRILTVDLPGHGQSGLCSNYSFETLTGLLAEWAMAMGVKNAVWLGMSVGCTVCLMVAVRYPSLVSMLVLQGPVAGYRPVWHPVGLLDGLVFKSFPLLLRASVGLFGHTATAHWLNTFGVHTHRSFKVLETIQQQADFKAIRQLLWQSSQAPYAKVLQQVPSAVRTLIIRGENDPMPRRFTSFIQKHLKHCRLVSVPHTRHLVSLEKPKMFNALLEAFIGEGVDTSLQNDPCTTVLERHTP